MIKEDKKLQVLLKQLAVEETPADFTETIMHRIEATAQKREVSLLKTKVIQTIAGMFILVSVTLLTVYSNQSIAIPFHFTLELLSNYITQITSFLLVFWVVMLSNHLYQRKEKHSL